MMMQKPFRVRSLLRVQTYIYAYARHFLYNIILIVGYEGFLVLPYIMSFSTIEDIKKASLPYFALLLRIVPRPPGTLEVLGEGLQVGGGAQDAVHAGRVITGFDLLFQGRRPKLGAPDLTPADPEELARREGQARQSRLLAVVLDPIL
jgi:hypothetical protein